MEWFWGLMVALLGLLAGSFGTTVVARVPDKAPLLRPGPRCASCGHPIAPRDRLPVVSWLVLRGRCRACREPIPVAFLAVEAGTAALFVLSYLAVGLSWQLPALLYLAALAVAATAIDTAHHRLPDAIVLPSYPIMFGLLVLALAGPGGPGDLVRAVLGGVVLFAGFLVLALINPAGMGGGDVKLAGVLGMPLGWVGWWAVVVGGLSSFFLGAIVGLVLMVVGRAGRKTDIPFGPFMFAGAYIGLLFGDSFGAWYLG